MKRFLNLRQDNLASSKYKKEQYPMTYQVIVQPSGVTFPVENTQTLIEAAIQAQVALPYACKSGACSTCKCQLVSGQVDLGNYQSHALTQAEIDKGMILACCAIAQSDLVIQAQIANLTLAEIQKIKCWVHSLEHVTHDVMIVRLQLPQDKKFKFQAGQYIDLELANGTRRSYSIANAQHTLKNNGIIELHIRLVPNGLFTTHVFNNMKAHDILHLEGPLGTFFLRGESSKPIIFLASGTGFAPIKAILEHMQHRSIDRQATLYWGCNQEQDLYMQNWIHEKQKQLPGLSYIPVITNILPHDHWSGRTGFVHEAVMQDHSNLSQFQVYACGSPVMVNAAKRDFIEQCQLAPEDFISDAFTFVHN